MPYPSVIELVRPRDGVGLEVVREREVAEHLEERLVARVVAHVLDVVGPHDLLRSDGAWVGRGRLAQEIRDELVHPGVREEQAGLRRRIRRRGADARVTAFFEERQEHLADAVAFHGGSLPVVRQRAVRSAGRCRSGAALRVRPWPACLLGSTRTRASRSPADPPLASRASVAGATRCACFFVHRLAMMAPVAPAPRPSATQNPRFTSCVRPWPSRRPCADPHRS